MEKVLVVDHEKCTGCRLCEMACSVTHAGVTLCPAIGAFATRELLSGERDPLLEPFGPERFDGTGAS